ncbi:MAG: OadG family protein [Anaerovorax sp.]
MENLSLMEKFADPALMDQMSAGDKLIGSLITTLMGMGITFVVLAVLWGLLSLMAKILKEGPKENVAPMSATIATGAAAVVGEGTPAQVTADEGQLVAVLMAAIVASEGVEYKNNLVIRKISRISGSTPSWGKAGVSEAIDTRRF